ncbi:hypothetical protein MMC13_002024 [Lambiella insularis]|nr:hypothetical protein [Lambiella insularis]
MTTSSVVNQDLALLSHRASSALSVVLSRSPLHVKVYAVLVLVILYLATVIIYNLYFHPLAKLSGPTIWKASRLPFVNSLVRGYIVRDVQKIHQKYGDIVRLAPDEVSFAKEESWDDIFTSRLARNPFIKDQILFKAPPGQSSNMLLTPVEADSARMKKLMGPAFTERTTLQQEPIVQSYVGLLMGKLRDIVTLSTIQKQGAVVDMMAWFNFYAFDVIGDLGLGESFGCLDNDKYHPWVNMVNSLTKTMTMAQATRYYPLLESVLLMLVPRSLMKKQQDHYSLAVTRIHRRMNLDTDRLDFMTPVLKENKGFGRMSLQEIESTYALLILVGSESVATSLSGVVNCLVQNPIEMFKLTQEIRGTFEDKSKITFAGVRDLPYLNAVIQEGLRLCNPLAAGVPRMVPQGGATVCGQFLPEYQTHITINPTAMSRSPTYFEEPESFLPDRFLPESLRPARFTDDNRGTQKPFGQGSRLCIGKPLALAQLRTVLARLVWEFDLEEVPGKRLDWTKQKSYFVTQKEPVMVRIRART